VENLEDLLKLGLALVLGTAIGIDRELRDKPAGIKTISLVTVAGTLLMIMSIRLGEMAGDPRSVDMSRLAAGVVTGIGFLGAGTIIKNRNQVEGITTAAVIWLMSGVGMALGAGLYVVAIEAYVAGWICLGLGPIEALMRRLLGKPDYKPLYSDVDSDNGSDD
jgi:putative Mg2+ transporter-C (MgtC) family protein